MNYPTATYHSISRIPPGFEQMYSNSNLPEPHLTNESEFDDLLDEFPFFQTEPEEVNFRGRPITSAEANYHRALARRCSYFVQKYSLDA
ncbi:hypothetical protein K7432_001485 [Basidiobolus ranarum]|uniref:Uncharacterized protein n=1 Tax=Basidiobolus ranarum TaxID=34480 RepID=A0ABR2X305_9FUNG